MRTSEEIITDIRECLRVGKRMTTLTLKDEYFDQAEIYVAELTELMNLPTPAEPASTITLIDSRVAGLEHRLALVEIEVDRAVSLIGVYDEPAPSCNEDVPVLGDQFVPLDELVSEGYVQEVNRQFFHPLGMALAVHPASGRILIIDDRDDLEGVRFGRFDLSVRAEKVRAVVRARRPVRAAALGYWVQPAFDEQV